MQNELPENAKMVFKGELFEVWQWEQKMYDGSTHIFERLKRTDTVQIIATIGEKIILQTEEQPDRPKAFLSLPGGRCDGGEVPLVSAKRELLEEAGYISDNWMLWQKVCPYRKIIWDVHTFIARDCVYKQPPHVDAGERITAHHVSFDEFLKLSQESRFRDKSLAALLLPARFDEIFRGELHKTFFGK